MFDEEFILLLGLLFIGKPGTKPLDTPRNEAFGGFDEVGGRVELPTNGFRLSGIASDCSVSLR
jgi:hypothetical protein